MIEEKKFHLSTQFERKEEEKSTIDEQIKLEKKLQQSRSCG